MSQICVKLKYYTVTTGGTVNQKKEGSKLYLEPLEYCHINDCLFPFPEPMGRLVSELCTTHLDFRGYYRA